MSASGQERFVNFYTDFAFQRLFEQAEIARNAKAMGIDSTTISQLTGISIEEIENL